MNINITLVNIETCNLKKKNINSKKPLIDSTTNQASIITIKTINSKKPKIQKTLKIKFENWSIDTINTQYNELNM